jgi:molybdate transport system substrate-binding protein
MQDPGRAGRYRLAGGIVASAPGPCQWRGGEHPVLGVSLMLCLPPSWSSTRRKPTSAQARRRFIDSLLGALLGSARVISLIRSTRLFTVLVFALGSILARPVAAGEVHVAVAANFAPVLERLAAEFERATGHRVLASPGSTGKLFAQIENGAPFEVFLSADAERPQKLEASGAAVAGSRFTYALGRLVLWSPRPGLVDGRGRVLAGGRFQHLAIANPETAPYGAAARQVLARLGLAERLAPRLVQGEDVGQTYQFVATGNAELGFVALSQVLTPGGTPHGSLWVVPGQFYDRLEQQAVLLTRGKDEPAARAFLEFLKGATARRTIKQAGYGLP